MSPTNDTLYFARRRVTLEEFDDILYSVREPEGIEDENDNRMLPRDIRIEISPNPFNSSTNIEILSSGATLARLAITDVSGQLITQTDLPLSDSGIIFRWDGTASTGAAVPSGVYFVTVRTDKASQTSKIIKLK